MESRIEKDAEREREWGRRWWCLLLCFLELGEVSESQVLIRNTLEYITKSTSHVSSSPITTFCLLLDKKIWITYFAKPFLSELTWQKRPQSKVTDQGLKLYQTDRVRQKCFVFCFFVFVLGGWGGILLFNFIENSHFYEAVNYGWLTTQFFNVIIFLLFSSVLCKCRPMCDLDNDLWRTIMGVINIKCMYYCIFLMRWSLYRYKYL